MKFWALYLIALCATVSDAYEECDDDQMAIIIDDSTSVDEIWEDNNRDQNPVLQFLNRFADEFDGVDLGVGVVTFAGEQNSKVVVPLTQSEAEWRQHISRMEHSGGLSSFSSGVKLAVDMLECEDNAEGCAKKHIVVITDGAIAFKDRKKATEALDAFKAKGGRVAFVAVKPKATNLRRLSTLASKHVQQDDEKPQPDIIKLDDIEELDDSVVTIGMFLCEEIRKKHEGLGPKIIDDDEEEVYDNGEQARLTEEQIDPAIEQALNEQVEKVEKIDEPSKLKKPEDVDCQMSEWVALNDGKCMNGKGAPATCGWGEVSWQRTIEVEGEGLGRKKCVNETTHKSEVCFEKAPGACRDEYEWWKSAGLGQPPQCDEYYYADCMKKQDSHGCKWTSRWSWTPGSTCYEPKTEEPSSLWGKQPRVGEDIALAKLAVPAAADPLACSDLQEPQREAKCVVHPRCHWTGNNCILNEKYMNYVTMVNANETRENDSESIGNCWKSLPDDESKKVITDQGLEAILKDYVAEGLMTSDQVEQARAQQLDVCDMLNVVWWYKIYNTKGFGGKAKMNMYAGMTRFSKLFGSRWSGNEVITSGYSLAQHNAAVDLDNAFENHVLKAIKPHRN